MHGMTRGRTAYTSIELLVVIVIITLLVAAAARTHFYSESPNGNSRFAPPGPTGTDVPVLPAPSYPVGFGNIDLRWGGKAVTSFMDGHVALRDEDQIWFEVGL